MIGFLAPGRAVSSSRLRRSKGQAAEKLAPIFGAGSEVIVEPDPARALERALALGEILGICGSIFLVGEIRQRSQERAWRVAQIIMYTVHMKRMTATDARKNWFRLLDEVVEGEVVLIERDGARLVLQLAEQGKPIAKVPVYQGLIQVTDTDEVDQWGWEWDGSSEGLQPRQTGPER